MRSFMGGTLLGMASLLTIPVAGQARDLRQAATAGERMEPRGYPEAPSPIALQVAVGYQNLYRGTAWTPVRVTLRNGSNVDVRGTLDIPQSSQVPRVGASPLFHGLYEEPVTLPAGGTKHITVYVPGSGLQGQVDVTFHQGNHTLATGSAYPMGLDSSALLIGMLTSNSGNTAWLAPAIQQQVTTHAIRLSTTMIDPVPQALAAFDIIVLTNVDTSQLDRAQRSALERYVQNGGSLLVVGGPTWQQTLRPLPAALLPGRLVGMHILPDLHGLFPLGPVSRPRGIQTSAVSVLSRPSGTILARQAGVPLVVRKMEGRGVIEYLAFDPALSPVRSWSGAPRFLRHLLTSAAPLPIGRTLSPQGFGSRFRNTFTSLALTDELSNLPPATLPLLALFAALTAMYVLILGPANFLILRRMGRQNLAWITIPVLALSYLGSTLGIATHFKSSTTLLNSVGMITLDGTTGPHPATFYLGLLAPLSGDYRLAYSAAALPAPIPQIQHVSGFSWRSASTLRSTPLGLRLQEGRGTSVTFLSMKKWSMRDVTLDTAVHIPGTVRGNLGVDARGDIAGSIHNGTKLDLLDPIIVAGQTAGHLPDISAGATVHARVRPSTDASGQDAQSFWAHLYGGPDVENLDGFGGFRRCCDQFSFPRETKLIDRIRNAVAMVSRAQPLSTLGEVVLVAWSERPLGTFTVDGSAPQRRDLNLIVMPLSVHFPSRGAFRLRTGTLGAHLVDMVPRAPQSTCCAFFSGNDRQISVGPGGSVTFEFDTPDARHVRFQRLALSVNGGDGGTMAGHVYDWHALRWVNVDLSTGNAGLPDPSRFVSSEGRMLVRLQASPGSGDLTIDDPYHDLQLSGRGRVT